jgi:hypothetical protein
MMDGRVQIIGSMMLDKVRGEKCKVDPVRTMKAYNGGRNVAPFILNLGT